MSSAGLVWSRPSILVTRLVRFGWDSSTFGSRPTSASSPATCSAAARSPGPEWSPGLVVSILIRSLAMTATSSCAVGPDGLLSALSVIPTSSHHVPGDVLLRLPRLPSLQPGLPWWPGPSAA